MTAANQNPADLLAAIAQIAEAAGISKEQLGTVLRTDVVAECPTIGEYLPRVEAATPKSTRATYRTYWLALARDYGDRRLDAVATSELKAFVQQVQEHALVRANTRGGISARETCVGALRLFFRLAVEDGVIAANPAAAIPKPPRPVSRRRGLTDRELAELVEVTRRGGTDPQLDVLLVRFHLETGARRGGCLALRVMDLDARRQCVLLREKGNTERWQPVSKTLLSALVELARTRGATKPTDLVFRTRPNKRAPRGTPITRRRYDGLVRRWHRALPWVALEGVSIHWLRHTAIGTVERCKGYGVARAFAGHTSNSETTTTYIRASLREVAQAVEEMTTEWHPLAHDEEEV